MKNKVLLINPPHLKNIRFNREGRCQQKVSSFAYLMVPMSLIYTAGMLRKNDFSVHVIDYMTEKDSGLKKVTDDIKAFSPDIIFISITIPSCYNDFQIVKFIRGLTAAHLASIGLMGSVLPEETLRDSELDSVIKGEPELASLELASRLREGKDFHEIEGISFKLGKEIIHNPLRQPIEDLDTLPFPARDLINQNAYTLPINRRPYTFIIPSRGCYHRCIFCQVKDYYGNKLRFRSISNIMEEVGEIIDRFGIKDIEIFSDNFTLDRSFVIDFCEGILKNGFKIRWMANSRVDAVDEKLLGLMKKAGCVGVSFGIESCSSTILENAKKDTTVEDIRNAVKWTKEKGIKVLAQMIIGLPGETKETIRETVRTLIELDPDFVQFNFAIPYPNTEFYEWAVKNSRLKEERWDCFELDSCIMETDALSIKGLKRMRVYAYMKYYLRFSTIKKAIREIKGLKDCVNFLRDSLNFFKEWVF